LTFLPPSPQEKPQIGRLVISADLFAPLTALFRGLCYDGTAKCRQIIRMAFFLFSPKFILKNTFYRI
jgi:hypothetical protein